MNYDKSHLMGQMVHEDSPCVSYKDSINDALMFWSSRAFHLIAGPAKRPLYLQSYVKSFSKLRMYKCTLGLAKRKHPTVYSCLLLIPIGLNFLSNQKVP